MQLPPLILDPSGVATYGSGLAFDAPKFRLLPLAQFPLIEDFQVELQETTLFGTHLHFGSVTRGRLAGFPWWDHVESDQRVSTGWMPVGSIEEPYWDLEESWEIAIAGDDDYIYVLEGQFELEPRRFLRYFSVRRSAFETAWHEAVVALADK